MASMLVARNRRVRVAAPFDEELQKRRRQERHVAPDYQHLLRRRFDERRVKASERTRSADAIDHYGNAHRQHTRPVVCDDQEMSREPAQQCQLPVEDGTGTDDERALVDAAEPSRLAAGKNRCCPGNHLIKA